MRILGIDPGTSNLGWGIIQLDGQDLLYHSSGVISASGKTVSHRIGKMVTPLRDIFRTYRPGDVALERCFVGKYSTAVLGLGRAIGMVVTVAGDFSLLPSEYDPPEVKRAVAHGWSGKAAVQQMVKRILGLNFSPQADEADALAVAICHSNRMFMRKHQQVFF